ncbi:hypothetical protein DSOL_2068 [Desulfosporosinus metallidurans]|uniref:Uncharacterized protein n=1 Tax=Desulfosporosinus metallidurans TaxID=1888891 RepID=A0A1Q8QXF5_9FIRM|nr:hypothetical protein DSOL_2068 [Desulfosporosinus metallidurans]
MAKRPVTGKQGDRYVVSNLKSHGFLHNTNGPLAYENMIRGANPKIP